MELRQMYLCFLTKHYTHWLRLVGFSFYLCIMTTNQEDPLIVTPTLLEVYELLEQKLENEPKCEALHKKWKKEVTKLKELLNGDEDTWLMWQNPDLYSKTFYKQKR